MWLYFKLEREEVRRDSSHFARKEHTPQALCTLICLLTSHCVPRAYQLIRQESEQVYWLGFGNFGTPFVKLFLDATEIQRYLRF